MLNNIYKINDNKYMELYENMNYKNIYVNYKYIKCLKSIFDIELYGIEKKKQIVGIFPIMRKNKLFLKYAPQPPFTQFFNLMIKKTIYKGQKFDNYYEYIVKAYSLFIKKNFIAYTLPQHYELNDIRVFKWNNMNLKILYSYLLKINKDNLNNIDRRIKNKEDIEFERTMDWEYIYNILKNSYSKRMPVSRNNFIILMKQLNKFNLIKSFIYNETFISFLIDEKNKIVYEYNVGGQNSGILLKSIFNRGLFNNYLFDFQGANIKSIAKYKSLFNPELKQYFAIIRII